MEFTAGFHKEMVYMLTDKPFCNNHTLTQVLNIDLIPLSDLTERLIELRNGVDFEQEGFEFSEEMEKIFSKIRDVWNTLDISRYVLWDSAHCQTSTQNQAEKAEFIYESYLKFFTDVCEARFRYGTFLDEYLNVGTNFLTEKQVAQKYYEFQTKAFEQKEDSLGVIGTAINEFFHLVVGDNHDTLVKCYKFDSLGAFLYFDFFQGLEINYIPKKCDNCGKYFLNTGGKFHNYCENPSPRDPSKPCREVGATARYQEKCKSDPVWQAYNRAYKTHYARYKKGKMTKEEFENWSAWAIEMRGKVQNEEMEFEDFVARIKV